jgi:hypothetical protein
VLLWSWTKIMAGLDSSGHSVWTTDYTLLPVSVRWKSSKTKVLDTKSHCEISLAELVPATSKTRWTRVYG